MILNLFVIPLFFVCGTSLVLWCLYIYNAADQCQNLVRLRKQAKVLDQKQKSVATVARLPREVIQTIFIHCIKGPRHQSVVPPNRLAIPLVLSHVCSTWRQAALGTFELWNHVHVRVQKARDLDIAHRWLSRARNSLVTLSADVGNSFEHKFVHGLLSSGHRIVSLRLQSSLKCLQLTMDLPKEFFGHLESLRFTMTDASCLTADPFFSADRNRLPRLKDASIGFRIIMFGRSLFVLPWDQLVHLDLSDTSLFPSQAIQVLTMCPLLQHCGLTIRAPSAFDHVEDIIVELSNLKSFDLSYDCASNFRAFVMALRLPNLRCLSIWAPWTDVVVADIAERWNFSKLDTLAFEGEFGLSVHLSSLLQTMPSLRHLVLPNMSSWRHTADLDDAPFLESITWLEDLGMDDARAVLTLVKQRQALASNIAQKASSDVAYIKQIQFTFADNVSVEDRRAFDEQVVSLKEHGIAVNNATRLPIGSFMHLTRLLHSQSTYA